MHFREDQAEIHAGVDTVPTMPATQSWASLEGGDIEAENVKTRPGGMQPQLDLGGPSTRADVTVKRLLDDTTETFIVDLENAVGKSTGWVSYQLLDADGGKIAGSQIKMTGVLKQVQKGNWDANASNAQFLGLVFSLDQEASFVSGNSSS